MAAVIAVEPDELARGGEVGEGDWPCHCRLIHSIVAAARLLLTPLSLGIPKATISWKLIDNPVGAASGGRDQA